MDPIDVEGIFATFLYFHLTLVITRLARLKISLNSLNQPFLSRPFRTHSYYLFKLNEYEFKKLTRILEIRVNFL